MIADARRVVILGHGAAQVPALGLSVKLMWGGVAAFEAAPDMFSNIVITSQPGDVVIGVSHQGRTRDTIELLRLARKFGPDLYAGFLTASAVLPIASCSKRKPNFSSYRAAWRVATATGSG